MKIKITSRRGHHEAVLETDVSRMIFEKLTGQRTEPLPAEIQAQLPETFRELTALWTPGKTTYLAVDPSADRRIRDFAPDAGEILFLAPVIGG
jgi:hypothetical protein